MLQAGGSRSKPFFHTLADLTSAVVHALMITHAKEICPIYIYILYYDVLRAICVLSIQEEPRHDMFWPQFYGPLELVFLGQSRIARTSSCCPKPETPWVLTNAGSSLQARDFRARHRTPSSALNCSQVRLQFREKPWSTSANWA